MSQAIAATCLQDGLVDAQLPGSADYDAAERGGAGGGGGNSAAGAALAAKLKAAERVNGSFADSANSALAVTPELSSRGARRMRSPVTMAAGARLCMHLQGRHRMACECSLHARTSAGKQAEHGFKELLPGISICTCV